MVWQSNKAHLLLLFSMLCLASWSARAADTPLSGINVEDFQKPKAGGLKWENNPFVQPVEGTSIHELVLTAIVHSEKDAAALINGQVVRVGDRIGLAEVVHITKKTVVLRNDNGIFSLPLKGSSK